MNLHSLMLLAAAGSAVIGSGDGGNRFLIEGHARVGTAAEHAASFLAECDARTPSKFQVTINVQERDVRSARGDVIPDDVTHNDIRHNGVKHGQRVSAEKNVTVNMQWSSSSGAGTRLLIAADGAPRVGKPPVESLRHGEPVYGYVITNVDDTNDLTSVFTSMGAEPATITWTRVSDTREPLTARFELGAQAATKLHDVAMGCRKETLPDIRPPTG